MKNASVQCQGKCNSRRHLTKLFYRKKARIPTAIAPILTKVVVPAPVNTAGLGLVGVVVELLTVPFESWKLAQVSRVVLLV